MSFQYRFEAMGKGKPKGKAKAQPKSDSEREIYRKLHSKLSYLKKKGGDDAENAEKALSVLNSGAAAREDLLDKFASDHKCRWLSSNLAYICIFSLLVI